MKIKSPTDGIKEKLTGMIGKEVKVVVNESTLKNVLKLKDYNGTIYYVTSNCLGLTMKLGKGDATTVKSFRLNDILTERVKVNEVSNDDAEAE